MKKSVVVSQQEYLQKILENFRKTQLALSEKISRQKKLLSRKSSEQWTPEKKKKVLSKISSANQEFNQVSEMISQIEVQLSQS